MHAAHKHSRGDVAQRMAKNKETEVTVVKCSWHKLRKSGSLALPMEVMLRDVNIAITEAYLLANMHVLRMCELHKAVPALDQSFSIAAYQQCLSHQSQDSHQGPTLQIDRAVVQQLERYRLSASPFTALAGPCRRLNDCLQVCDLHIHTSYLHS